MKILKYAIPFTLFFTFACSKSNDLTSLPETTNELNTKTESLNEKTQSLNEQTESLNDKTNDLSSNIGNMFIQMRLKEAEETRDRRSQNIIEATSFEQKVTEAAAYFRAFEYQLWSNQEKANGDNLEIRHEKMLAATQEFFRFIRELKEGLGENPEEQDKQLNQFTQSLTKKGMVDLNLGQSINALSLAMHISDDFQLNLIKNNPNLEEVNMLKMIVESLYKLKSLNAGKISLQDLKEYEKEVLDNEELAIKLLQLRLNSLSISALALVSDIKNKNALQRFAMMSTAWESSYSELNLVKQDRVNQYIEEALKVRTILKDLGNEDQVDESLSRIFEHMTEQESANKNKSIAASNKKNTADFQRLIANLIK